MKVGSLFSGYGGLDMGVEAVLGAAPAWFVEVATAPARVLAHHWPGVPNHGDVAAVDWDAVERVDVLAGGFPCQDLSHAGKRLGLRPGTRSGLWEHMAYAIDRLRPRLVVIENVRGLLSAEAHSDMERDCWCVGDEREPALRALGAVLGDLAGLGYDARWGGVRAADAGAPHGRFRVFIAAQPADAGRISAQVPAGRELSAEPQPRSDGPQGGTVALLPTPTSQAAKHGALAPSEGGPDRPQDNSNLWAVAASDLSVNFGPYADAVARWEQVLGRPAPSPTEPGRDGRPRLSPAFVEWMMGLPAGHVTDPTIGLARAQQLKALGNGVVPQQAALALRALLGAGG